MDEINQSIKENGNIQAARDAHVNIVTPQPISTQNLISCPSCKSPTSYTAQACPACGHNVYGHFLAIHELKREKKYGIALLAMMVPVLSFALYHIWAVAICYQTLSLWHSRRSLLLFLWARRTCAIGAHVRNSADWSNKQAGEVETLWL